MKKVEGLVMDQDDIATAVCEFVAKVHPEYADVKLSDVAFIVHDVTIDGFDMGITSLSVQVEMKDDDSSDESSDE
jgi:hypothetical protein